MALSQEELATRLRAGRESAGLTQHEAARQLAIPRSAVVQMEAGSRKVSGLELARLAHIYGRSVQDLLAPEFAADGVSVLLRALPDTGEATRTRNVVLDAVELVREIISLEDLLGVPPAGTDFPTYHLTVPRTRWQAVQDGKELAHRERQRLELGTAPITDPGEVLESQGLTILELMLPAHVSGFTVRLDGRTACGVNVDHPAPRRRFSLVHEYCHAVADSDRPGIVSTPEEQDELREVRANAFAIHFLAPEDGVQHFLRAISKGLPSRPREAVIGLDQSRVEIVEGRLPPGSQEVGLWAVCALAHRFGVSTEAIIWHLFNMRLLDETERQKLHEAVHTSLANLMMRWFRRFEREGEEEERARPLRLAHQRLLRLAIDAYRGDEISRAKFLELCKLGRVSEDEAVELANVTPEA